TNKRDAASYDARADTNHCFSEIPAKRKILQAATSARVCLARSEMGKITHESYCHLQLPPAPIPRRTTQQLLVRWLAEYLCFGSVTVALVSEMLPDRHGKTSCECLIGLEDDPFG